MTDISAIGPKELRSIGSAKLSSKKGTPSQAIACTQAHTGRFWVLLCVLSQHTITFSLPDASNLSQQVAVGVSNQEQDSSGKSSCLSSGYILSHTKNANTK